MLTHMRTSIDIPEALLRRAKKLARERGITLRQLLLEGLRSRVESPAVREHRMKDCSFGEGGLVSGLSWSDLDRLEELTYGDRV
jgi:hypothetical protein